MADWSQLPNDLLHLISIRLHSPLDVVRFRSICFTWRSATTSPKNHCLPPRIPFIPVGEEGNSSGYYYTLLKRTVFLFKSPKINIQTDPSATWIIKIEHGYVSDNLIKFYDPLSGYPFIHLPYNFPKGSNLLDFRVIELKEEYVLDFDYLTHGSGYNTRKVAFSCLDSNANDFVLLSIIAFGYLAMFKSSDQKWTKFPSSYDDVILYKGKFYAVDESGRTVLVVGLDSKINVVGVPAVYADDGGHGYVRWISWNKFLVESKGELLLVYMYLSFASEVRNYKFNVFKLDEVNKEWIEVNNLDDRVLFLSTKRGFAASAEDLSLFRGNYIIFVDDFENILRVFDLENGSTQPLRKFPQFDKLYLPSWMNLEEIYNRKIEENNTKNGKDDDTGYKRKRSNKVATLGMRAAASARQSLLLVLQVTFYL
ncbi:hypothetical protein PTKIN_Ptkin04bG0227000 [Pterospermum kingtungense]